MEPAAGGRPTSREFPRPGPIGLAIRMILGVATISAFVAIITKWNIFLESDPFESERYFSLVTPWALSPIFNLIFRRRWGAWPSIGFVAVGAVLGGVGLLLNEEFWNPVVTAWVFAADVLVFAVLAVSFPVAVAARSPGCEIGAIPWVIARRTGGFDVSSRPACIVGLDHLDRWEAARRRERQGRDDEAMVSDQGG